MRYSEFKKLVEEATINNGFYQPEDDVNRKAREDDTRRPKLTLKMVNKLKKIRAAKKLEVSQKQQVLGVMYGAPAEDDSGGL